MEHMEIIIAAVIVIGFILGIRLMQMPQTALWGNRLGAFCMLLAILYTLSRVDLLTSYSIWILLIGGGAVGAYLGYRVKMIQMPQMVALFNGLGGGASAVISGWALVVNGVDADFVFWLTGLLALSLGAVTFIGSLIAALKLQGIISQKPVILAGHKFYLAGLLIGGIILIAGGVIVKDAFLYYLMPAIIIVFLLYGILMALRVGGADMPIIIAFFNSLSGVATAICGLSVENLFLVGVGSLVGVAGLILTQLMCRAMNRSLPAVLQGFKSEAEPGEDKKEGEDLESRGEEEKEGVDEISEEPQQPEERIRMLADKAQKIIVIPGYGMAVAQAQQQVHELIKTMENRGKEVKIAIHPVAGRMPGHMNVLLAEAGIPYEKLFEPDTINPEFSEADLVLIVGACDVVNSAANTAEGTPIYGMPILNAHLAPNIVICNYDDQPGYSGVDNPLYREDKVIAMWGDAAETIPAINEIFKDASPE